MDNKQLIRELELLLQVNRDAVRVYDTAIAKMDDSDVKNDLKTIREEHSRHINALSKLIDELGGPEPLSELPAFDIDISGTASAIDDATTTHQILDALSQMEEIATGRYKEVVKNTFSGHIKDLLKDMYDDEKRHKKILV